MSGNNNNADDAVRSALLHDVWDLQSPSDALQALGDLMRQRWQSAKNAQERRGAFTAMLKGFDVWSKLYRLYSDAEEAEALRSEINDLRELVEQSTGKSIPFPGVAK